MPATAALTAPADAPTAAGPGWAAPLLGAAEGGGAGPPGFLLEVVALVAAAAVIAYVSQRAGLVSIVGFLLAGVVIGPSALGVVGTEGTVEAAAEIGVLLLLFTIGIEFSLGRLLAIRRVILLGGALQVGLAIAATTGVLALAGVGWRSGVYTGMLVALSSTAIVLSLLAARGETGTSQGQVALGLLIFQDLAIVVMVLLVPALGSGGGSPLRVVLSLLQAAGIILVVLLVARRLMPPLLESVARTCAPEVFLLTLVAVATGTAYVTSVLGVSLSLGAFLAGLMVSESRFASHALGEILPLQILFSAVFFVSVGMLLDLGALVDNAGLVAAGVVLVLAVKTVTTWVGVRALRLPAGVAAASALLLAQVGEFSFVLEGVGRQSGLSPADRGEAGSQAFIAVTVLLMVATPFLSRLAPGLVARSADRGTARPDQGPLEETPLEGHVVVAGYGDAARALVQGLERQRVEYVIATLSPDGATEADGQGRRVLAGDYTKAHTLRAAGADRARLLVVPDDRDDVVERVTAVARALNPGLRIVARASEAGAAAVAAAGADVVLTDARAGAVAVVLDVLRTAGAPDAHVLASAHRIAATGADLVTGTDGQAEVVELSPSGAGAAACRHLDEVGPVLPRTPGCEECLRVGDGWVHLRVCTSCGHVGCCDSSPGRHASGHWRESGHPVVASLEQGEDWGWCYADDVRL